MSINSQVHLNFVDMRAKSASEVLLVTVGGAGPCAVNQAIQSLRALHRDLSVKVPRPPRPRNERLLLEAFRSEQAQDQHVEKCHLFLVMQAQDKVPRSKRV